MERSGVSPGEPDVGFNKINDILDALGEELVEERKLTQYLGVSLRGVMDAAEQGRVSAIMRSAQNPDDNKLDQKAQQTNRAVQRAQHALDTLQASHLNINFLEDNHFDESFDVNFEE